MTREIWMLFAFSALLLLGGLAGWVISEVVAKQRMVSEHGPDGVARRNAVLRELLPYRRLSALIRPGDLAALEELKMWSMLTKDQAWWDGYKTGKARREDGL
jgi:Tfp pilus assembly ATPase PilU